MNSLGLYLRGLREGKGMSLDDISRSTRVGRRHLEALEGDTPGELPAPVFVKGFIRAYCEFLECPPDHALNLYRETTGEPAPTQGPVRPLLSTRSRRAGPLVISIVLFVALGLSLLALRVGLQSSHKSASPAPVAREEVQKAAPIAPPSTPSPAKAPAAAPAAPAAPPAAAAASETTTATTTVSAPQAASSPPTPSPTSVSTSTAPTAPAAAGATSGNHHLVVRAVEPTWLRVQVDDGQVAEELLQAGAVREWSATKRFTLTVGNAGGVEIDLNGKRLPSLGAKGAVIQRLVLPQEQPGSGS
jgi:cytoskeleton protein RodZ